MPKPPLTRPVTIFAAATLIPVLLLTMGASLGGVWIVVALLYLTAFAFLMDQAIAMATPDAPPGCEFPAANGLSVLLAVAHFGLLFMGVWAVSGGSGLDHAGRIAAFLAFGLFFGQISNSNAHELIHRARRPLFWLGAAVFTSHLFGHHASAHPRVHHRLVATPGDPNSARLGESFYHFAPRAWIGSFGKGLAAENARMASGRSGWRHPYVAYIGGGVALCGLMAFFFGLPGLLAYLALAGYATSQLLLSDYVQHYGLTRDKLRNGRYSPVNMRHSWNAPHWFSSYMMLNAPRHSDHHAHPGRVYPALTLPAAKEAPMLPLSLPAMATLALLPRTWRRVMDRRALRWQSPAG